MWALGDMLLGRTLRAVLALPDRGFRRLDVLGVLTNAPLLDGDGHVPGHAWERLSREAGVVSGDDWAERLAVLAAEQRRRAELDDEEGCDLRAERRRRDANRAEALAAFVARLRGDLAAGAEARSWAALVAANGLIDSYLGDDRRRVRWPEEEKKTKIRSTNVRTIPCRLCVCTYTAGPLGSCQRGDKHAVGRSNHRRCSKSSDRVIGCWATAWSGCARGPVKSLVASLR